MVNINTVSDIKNLSNAIKHRVRSSTNNRELQVLNRRAKYLLKETNQINIQKSIRKTARKEYRSISKEIRRKKRSFN